MKKIISIIAALTVFVSSVRADEGMWLLPLLQKMNAQAMRRNTDMEFSEAFHQN